MARTDRNIDKGYAWVVLAGAFFVQMIAAMLTYSPGVLNIVILQEVDNDLVKTSWIGSTLYGTFTLMGPVAGLVYKKLGPRLTTVIGGIIVLLGMTTASLCRSIEGLILTYGLTTGLGMCLGGNVVGVVPGEYFMKRRSVAYGVTMSGGAMGLFVAGPMLRFLLTHYGLSGTLLLFGAVAFHVCVAGMLFWNQGPVVQQQLDKSMVVGTVDDVKLKYFDKSRYTDGCIHLKNFHKNDDGCSGDVQFKDLDYTKEDECIPLKTLENDLGGNKDVGLTNTEEAKEECIHLNIDHSKLYWGERSNVSICDNNNEDMQHSDIISKEHIFTATNLNKTSDTNKQDLKKQSNHKALRKIPNLLAFLFYNISIIFWSLGEAACMFHLPNYVQSKGSSFAQASTMFTAVGAGGLFSRIITGLFASDTSIGYKILHVGLSGISGTIVLLFPLYSYTYPLQLTFSVLYGVYNQGINALMSPITISLIGLSNVALGFGVVYFSCGVGFFAGPPVASAIFKQSGSYDTTYYFSGSCLIMSSFSTAVAHIFAHPIRED